MENNTCEKAKLFKGLNEIALKGEVVVYGSSYMADFPFYELTKKNHLDIAIYNRSIKNLNLSDAAKLLNPCVFELMPSKVFLHFGEDEKLQENSFDLYEDLIKAIKRALPDTIIYIIEIQNNNEAAEKLNRKLFQICDNKKTIFVEFNRTKYLDFKQQFRKLCYYFRSGSIGFCEAFAMV